ncbi:hypothetical protein GCM10027037_08910 [Mucilaginibacter koreensis]
MAKLIITAILFTITTQFSNKRLLLIYADQANNTSLIQQQQLLKSNATGLNERDVTVKVYLRSTSPKEFNKKHISSDFTVILIGKDNGEKLRTHQVVTAKQLFSVVDAMPMRKQEMKDK